MSRLIDADALIEYMKKTEEEYEDAMTCPSWWTAYSVISEQPTAYDVEKVVAELENFSLDTTPHCNEVMRKGLCDGIADCDYCKIQYAIDIVKAGGVE